jgi:hypothetical protein
MTEWASTHTMLTLLCIAGSATAIWAAVVLIRSLWLDEYGRPKE